MIDLEWIKREHPSGFIDFEKEYVRLLEILDQSLPSIKKRETNTTTRLLEIAVAVGKDLLDYMEFKRTIDPPY